MSGAGGGTGGPAHRAPHGRGAGGRSRAVPGLGAAPAPRAAGRWGLAAAGAPPRGAPRAAAAADGGFPRWGGGRRWARLAPPRAARGGRRARARARCPARRGRRRAPPRRRARVGGGAARRVRGGRRARAPRGVPPRAAPTRRSVVPAAWRGAPTRFPPRGAGPVGPRRRFDGGRLARTSRAPRAARRCGGPDAGPRRWAVRNVF